MNKPFIFLLLSALLLLFPSCGSAPAEDSGSKLASGYFANGNAGSLAEVGGITGAGVSRISPAPVPSGLPAAPGPGTGTGLAGMFTDRALALSGIPQGSPVWGQDSLATLVMGVESVEGAASQVQAIAESLDGSLDRLSSYGNSGNARADIVIKVPQNRFALAMSRIEVLGETRFRSLGSEDVTDEHVDLTARLASYRQEEQSLNSLLERSDSVSELVSVERELARVRANIARDQGQLDLLRQRVDLATIQVTLLPLGTSGPSAPVASFTLDVPQVTVSLRDLRKFVTDRGGEIDQVYLASSGDQERAEVVFRMFERDYGTTTRFIEDQGHVVARELLERRGPPGRSNARLRQPGASFQVSYTSQPAAFSVWAPILIVVGLLLLAAAVTYLMRLSYRRGRQRGSFL